MNRNVLILVLCQALYMTGIVLLVANSALVGVRLASEPMFATIPMATLDVVAMLVTVPAAFAMQALGRRIGLILGAAAGALGAIACTLAISQGSFLLFLVGSGALGVFIASGQFYRFAAAEVVASDYRSRAISLVMAGGVIAAFVGPALAKWTKDSAGPEFSGNYIALAVLCVVSAALVGLTRIPVPRSESHAVTEKRRASGRLGLTFVVAALASATSYGVMTLVMTSTPLAMEAHGQGFAHTAGVIQCHMLGMFVPAFFTGHLIRKFGVFQIMSAGGVILLVSLGVNASGVALIQFALGLLLLGVGWNFLFIGATTLLAEAYSGADKAKAQGWNEFCVSASMVAGSALAAVLYFYAGWTGTNLAMVPPILVAIAAATWLGLRRNSSVAPAPAA